MVALALAPEVALARTGRALIVGELSREFGFTDVDGQKPPPFRVPDGP